MKQVITKNEEDTKDLAKEIVKKLKSGDILALVGDLGGGKTTFTKGLAKAFGILEKEVQSPTFTLIKEYKLSKNAKVKSKKYIRKLYHLDMYRINSEKEAENLGLEELFSDKNSIFVVEWADRIKKLLPEKAKWIEFSFIDEKTRKIVEK